MDPEDEDDADVDASQREEDEEEDEDEEKKEDEDDEKVVRGWGNLKERLAASGAMLNVARLADDAAREIHRLGAAVFSRGPTRRTRRTRTTSRSRRMAGTDVESEEEDSLREPRRRRGRLRAPFSDACA